MNVAIISDTHLKQNTGQLNNLITEFHNVDLVIHAGDYGDVWVLEFLKNHFNFIGVWGNNDDNRIKSCLKEKLILHYELGIAFCYVRQK